MIFQLSRLVGYVFWRVKRRTVSKRAVKISVMFQSLLWFLCQDSMVPLSETWTSVYVLVFFKDNYIYISIVYMYIYIYSVYICIFHYILYISSKTYHLFSLSPPWKQRMLLLFRWDSMNLPWRLFRRFFPFPTSQLSSFKTSANLRSRQKTWLEKDGSHCEDASRSTGGF